MNCDLPILLNGEICLVLPGLNWLHHALELGTYCGRGILLAPRHQQTRSRNPFFHNLTNPFSTAKPHPASLPRTALLRQDNSRMAHKQIDVSMSSAASRTWLEHPFDKSVAQANHALPSVVCTALQRFPKSTLRKQAPNCTTLCSSSGSCTRKSQTRKICRCVV